MSDHNYYQFRENRHRRQIDVRSRPSPGRDPCENELSRLALRVIGARQGRASARASSHESIITSESTVTRRESRLIRFYGEAKSRQQKTRWRAGFKSARGQGKVNFATSLSLKSGF